jgi:hypothetical protein
MKTRTDLVEVILSMNYGELLAVAEELAKMKDDEVRPKIETPQEYAELLFDWAEAEKTNLFDWMKTEKTNTK